MTQEEKAKAYDEAIEKAKQTLEASSAPEAKMIVYHFFPELRESEDEITRKRLINLIRELASATLPIMTGGYFIDGQDKRYIAYLEKQKDKMTAEEFESSELFQLKLKTKYANGYQDGLAQKEQKPADLPPGFYFIDLDGNRYYSKEFRYGDMKMKIVEDKSEKPAEWSEEDNNMFDDILLDMADRMEMFKSAGETTFAEDTQKKIDWLSSHYLQLKYQSSCPQAKQEWGEEDKKTINMAIETLEHEGYPVLAERLKSFRSRTKSSNNWKPSEEQMEALEYVIRDYREDSCNATANYLQEILDHLKNM